MLSVRSAWQSGRCRLYPRAARRASTFSAAASTTMANPTILLSTVALRTLVSRP